MQFVVLGIVTLSCFPLSVLSSFFLRVDVTLPKMIPFEKKDIKVIKDVLNGLRGTINVRYNLKAFDNKRVLLILEVKRYCSWLSLASDLSAGDFQLSVTDLETCDGYAKQIGVQVTYQSWKKLTNLPVVRFYDQLYNDQGSDGAAYLAQIKQHMRNDSAFQKKGITGDCYRYLTDLPVRMIYFSGLNAAQEAKLSQRLIGEGKAQIDHQWFQNVRDKKYC